MCDITLLGSLTTQNCIHKATEHLKRYLILLLWKVEVPSVYYCYKTRVYINRCEVQIVWLLGRTLNWQLRCFFTKYRRNRYVCYTSNHKTSLNWPKLTTNWRPFISYRNAMIKNITFLKESRTLTAFLQICCSKCWRIVGSLAGHSRVGRAGPFLSE